MYYYSTLLLLVQYLGDGLLKKVYRDFNETFSKTAATSAKILFVKETREAIKQAPESGKEKALPVLCTGSFYLVSEVKQTINHGV